MLKLQPPSYDEKQMYQLKNLKTDFKYAAASLSQPHLARAFLHGCYSLTTSSLKQIEDSASFYTPYSSYIEANY